ncbi:IS30 family transposase [Pseudarthrobacter enclensis]|uniref:IS30 family transposase n=1 Tax=Pseudarthrobacter enclensis TaxID=993070 RepID=A0ABT9RZE1_9MICC|nr:IS30 family transposase [Pseudarthrobacter enclensis]
MYREITRGTFVYFYDPGRPWQRGSNENTDGMQWDHSNAASTFLKEQTSAFMGRTPLSVVATELNQRPREILGWQASMEHPV